MHIVIPHISIPPPYYSKDLPSLYLYSTCLVPQVIATAVSRAAALSRTRTTITEIADELGLERHMIAKCQRRFDQLDDGEWEALFDDRQVCRTRLRGAEKCEMSVIWPYR